MNDTIELRFAGFGGQGIVLMGIALARAAVMYDLMDENAPDRHRYAIQTQSYGPSARGGHSRCDIKISDEEIYYPFIDQPEYLVIMSEQAYKKYGEDLEEGGLLIIDADLVRERPHGKVFTVPATRFAEEELGTRVVSNMIMLGAVQEITGVVTFDSLMKAVVEMVPPVTHELNKKALERGRELGKMESYRSECSCEECVSGGGTVDRTD